MSLEEKVKKSLIWKQNDHTTANRLKMSVEEFRKIKQMILAKQRQDHGTNPTSHSRDTFGKDLQQERSVKYDHNEKENKATLEYNGPKEIKTKEDLIRECNIDLDKWTITRMIHNSWGKEGNQNYQVKAWLEPKTITPEEIFKTILNETSLSYSPSAPIHINEIYEDKTCAVLSLQDIHIGKQNIEGVYDIVDSVKKCIQTLIMRSYHSSNLDKIIFVIGGDLLNVDTFNGTTTAGTAVESNMSALDMYKEAFELMFWAINYIKQFTETLEVVYIPGNHDRLVSGQLTYSLSKIITDSNIIWNIDYAERKVVTYGNSMIALEHGDVTINKSFVAFATEFPVEWGSTKFRTLYTGHYHKEKKVEYITTDELNGFTMKILPSLSRMDRYHHTNKWTNNKRGGIIELHSETKGPTGTFSYYE